MIEVEFRRFNHGSYGAHNDQTHHGPVELLAKQGQGDILRSIAEAAR